jgi:hypothetical protein
MNAKSLKIADTPEMLRHAIIFHGSSYRREPPEVT